MQNDFLLESLMKYVGRTVTIFTTSGGIFGAGFTGVLAGVCGCTIKLITEVRDIIKPTQKTLDLSGFQRVGHFFKSNYITRTVVNYQA